MFKTNDRRFEYDITPHLAEDAELFPPYSNHQRNSHPYPVSSTTPINRRSSFAQGASDTRERYQVSQQEQSYLYETGEDRTAGRARVSSTTGFKRSVDKGVPRN